MNNFSCYTSGPVHGFKITCPVIYVFISVLFSDQIRRLNLSVLYNELCNLFSVTYYFLIFMKSLFLGAKLFNSILFPCSYQIRSLYWRHKNNGYFSYPIFIPKHKFHNAFFLWANKPHLNKFHFCVISIKNNIGNNKNISSGSKQEMSVVNVYKNNEKQGNKVIKQ
jgi:hypothetical protein